MSELFSHTKVNCFKQCPKLYQYKYIDKLEPLGNDTKSLSMGKAFHVGIEHCDVQATIDYMNNDDYFMSEETEIDKAICIAMVQAFINKYPECKNWKHEQFMTCNLCHNEDDFQLYIDGLEKHNDGYYIVELKSSSRVDQSYIDKLEFNDQISRYWYASEKNGYKILGIKYYIVKKPLLKQKQTETMQQFINRLVERLMEEDNIIDLVINRTESQIKDCIDDTIYDIKSIESATRYTKNLTACSVYGTCPYMKLCMGVKDAELLFTRREDKNVTEERESD